MNTIEQYNKVIEQCRSLFTNKMKDYGSAWRILRLPSLTDQIFIKAQRIRGLQENAVHKIDEDETTEFIGIINYALIHHLATVDGHDLQPRTDVDTRLRDRKSVV